MKSECCAFCGSNNGVLKPYYALPIHLGGGDTDSNKIYLCLLHSLILEEVHSSNTPSSEDEIHSLRSALNASNRQIENLENEVSTIYTKHAELLTEFSKMGSHRDALIEEISSAKSKSLVKESNQISCHKEGVINANVEFLDIKEFGVDFNSYLNEESVKLTLSTFDDDLNLTAEALGCSVDEIKIYIDIDPSSKFIDSVIEHDIKDGDKLNDLTDSPALVSSKNSSIGFQEINEENPSSSYKVAFLNDCSILAKALDTGVHFSTKGEPLINQVSENKLQYAMTRNGWNRELFRDSEKIKSLLDETIAIEAKKKTDIHKLSSVTGVSNTFIIESMRRTKQAEDVINEVIRLTYIAGSPRTKFLSSKWQ